VIREVRANKHGFHPVVFEPGMNLVLADVTPASGVKDTRNGVGKTSLIEIMHFCLGSTLRKGDTLKEEALADWAFSMSFDLGAQVVTVTRSIASPRTIVVASGDGERTMSLAEWIAILGRDLFDIPERDALDVVAPGFRSLISYVARRDRYAYDNPFDHHPKIHAWDRQVNIAYLLGLGWRDAAGFEMVRRKKKWLRDQLAASKAGVGDTKPGQRGRLEADRVRLAEDVEGLAEQLQNFRVHPEHRRIEDEANLLTRELQAIANENVAEKNLLSHYRNAAADELAPEDQETLELFDAAKVELTGAVRRELHELRAFHAALVTNRRAFLATEIAALEERIETRSGAAERIGAERASKLAILNSSGSLDEYTKIQARLTERRERLARTESHLAAIDRLEEGGRTLRLEAQAAYDRAKVAHDERQVQRDRAISLFNGYSQFLYDEPGNLLLDVRQVRGMPTFEFGVEIVRSKATGIEHMKTLCLDLTIAAIWAARPTRPGFLVHDSAVFEGVDERQRASALVLAEREARTRGYQYILALNTDELPKALPSGFDPKRYERLRLTDDPPTGSLFGMRF
jgi:uncharacterized protein YydD (DUF2326 family)